ncbi:MAG: phosphate ABC transporter permease [Acidobacteria bacterium]|nr:MAG: phosphate ABC transporter permease [Acidobacteriota bacterium]
MPNSPEGEFRPTPLQLPNEPLVVIEASKAWVPLNLRELWAYRELLYFLTWRDLKVRYKQTIIGVLWVVMQPLLTAIIFAVFLGKLVRVPSDGIPYAIFVYAGLLPWTFFASAVASSGNSLVGSSHLITKVFFPRIIIPVAAIGARLVDFAISFLIFGGMMVYYRIAITRHLLMLALFVPLITLLALAVGMLISALNVKYRDVGMAVPVLIQLWMFASPIVYPSSLVPSKWQKVYALNPIAGIVEGFRSSLFAKEFDWMALGFSSILTFALLIYSAYAFRRREKEFADIV